MASHYEHCIACYDDDPRACKAKAFQVNAAHTSAADLCGCDCHELNQQIGDLLNSLADKSVIDDN